MFLGLVLALNKLAKAASNKAQEDRETVITSRHIASVAPVSYKNMLKQTQPLHIPFLVCIGHIVEFEGIEVYFLIIRNTPKLLLHILSS